MVQQYSKPPFIGGFRPVAARGLGVNVAAPSGTQILRGWPVSTNDANNVAPGKFCFVNSAGKFTFNIPASYSPEPVYNFGVTVEGGLLAEVPGQFPAKVESLIGIHLVTADDVAPNALPLSDSGYSWRPGRQFKIWGQTPANPSFTTQFTNQEAVCNIPQLSTSDNTLIDGGGHNPNLPGEGGMLIGGRVFFQPNGWNPDFSTTGSTTGPYSFLAGQQIECFFFFQTLPDDNVNPDYACYPYITKITVFGSGFADIVIPLTDVHIGFGAGSAGLPWPPWPGSPGDGYGQPWNPYAPAPTAQPPQSGGLTSNDNGYQDVWLDIIPPPVPSVPFWVEALRAPSGDLPYIVMDFENNRYWKSGFVVGIGDIVEADQNFSGANWLPGTAIVQGKGLQLNSAAVGWVMYPTVSQPIIAGSTVLIRMDLDPAQTGNYEVDLANISFAIDHFGLIESDGAGNVVTNVTGDAVSANLTHANTSNNGTAFTLRGNVTSTQHMSLDGAGDVSSATTAGATDPERYCAFAVTSLTSYNTLTVFYPPQPDADLPAISMLPVPVGVMQLENGTGNIQLESGSGSIGLED